MGDSTASIRIGTDATPSLLWRGGYAVLTFGSAMTGISIEIPDHMFKALSDEYRGMRVSEMDIDDIEMPKRLRAALRGLGISTLGEAVQIRPKFLLEAPNFGRKTLAELYVLTEKYRIEWRAPVRAMDLDVEPK